MYYTVYKITNNTNGHYYIGQHKTKNLDDGYMGSGKALLDAYKKYGKENFTKEILHVFETQEEMNDKEKELVVPKHLDENSYNLAHGGESHGFDYINRYGLSTGWKTAIEKGVHLNNLPKMWANSHKWDYINERGLQKIGGHRGGKSTLAKGKNHFVTDKAYASKNGKKGGQKNVKSGHWNGIRTCPHCGHKGKGLNMYKYHFDKCKKKPLDKPLECDMVGST